MLRRLIALAIAASFIVIASGCNTMRGMGQDIERGGEKIQDKAERKS
jgi:entericidin B